MRQRLRFPLHAQIATGLVAGALAGGFVHALWPSEAAGFASWMRPAGSIFVRLITMVAAPLVLTSLVVGASSISEPSKLGRIGLRTLILYVSTTAVAIAIGVVLATALRPGSGLPPDVGARLLEGYRESAEARLGSAPEISWAERLVSLVPSNPFGALADGEMLQVVVFALLTGIALALVPRERAEPAIRVFDALNDAMIKIVELVMRLAPYGVFALVGAVTADIGFGVLWTLGAYSLVVVAGLVVHLFGTYSLLLAAMARGKVRIRRFFRAMASVQLLGFASSSSAATLPLNMETVRDRVGVSERITAFVLPLGATVNMDGTALYQGVAAVFIAQVYGLPLGLGDLATIVVTATLASIGTAAVPGAGIVMLVIVLQSIGIPAEGIALILGVDRILDMCRTVVNVTGDAAVAVCVAAAEGELGEPRAVYLADLAVVEPGSGIGGTTMPEG